MSNISILITGDDLNKIASIIETIKECYSGLLAISQASNVQEAIENLQNKEFHLLITDLQMPLKYDSIPIDDGGISLIKGIYRKRTKANVPMYIVGLTQHSSLQPIYQGVWKIWHYDNAKEEWKISLRDLVFHIGLVKSRIAFNKIQTIFLEGPTDKKILETAIRTYFPWVRRICLPGCNTVWGRGFMG